MVEPFRYEPILGGRHPVPARSQKRGDTGDEHPLVCHMEKHFQRVRNVEATIAKVEVHEVAGDQGDVRHEMAGSADHFI